ncbi:MAG: esterase/lipase family protein [Acutalibacteraceae bacterium]
MKRISKRLLSVLLVMVTLVSIALPMTAEAAATSSTYPVVYVKGRRTPLYNKNGKQIYPLKTTIQEKLIQDKSTLMSAFNKSLLTNNWDPLCDAIYNSIAPLYSELVLDNNGEIANGSYHKKSDTPTKKTSNYKVSDYIFQYDSRVDPIASAKELHTYIKSVLKATGQKKVNLVGRCLGSSIVASYLTLYGNTYVDTVLFYAAACNGILPIGATFSGHIQLDADSIQKYADTNLEDGDDFDEFIRALVTLTNQAKLLGVGTDKINSVYLSIADQILPKLLLATYATMPCYWSMVSDEYFEAAKSFIFKGETKKYAGLIKKINNYHYNVQVPLNSTLTKLKKNGLKVINISKYNVRLAPVFENCNVQADGTVELSTMSFGATSANIGKTLSKTYLKNVAASGMSSYVSKDSMIDSSTCLFPDSTWFIKNLKHTTFPSCVNYLIYEAFSSKGQFTIKSNKNYPQYLEYKDNTLVAVTQSNPDDLDKDDSSSSILTSTLKVLITAFTSTFGTLIKIVSGILSSQK